jgi:hypothetical protein
MLKKYRHMKIAIKEITNADEKSQVAEKIVRSLPEWFELEGGIVEYIAGVKDKPFFAAIENDTV